MRPRGWWRRLVTSASPVALVALSGCRGSRPPCGPARQELPVLVEGNLLAHARLSLEPAGERGRLVLAVSRGEGVEPVVIVGAGTCRDGIVVAELEPGPAPAEGVRLLGGESRAGQRRRRA